MAKEKKPATPKSVDELVLHALKTAATKPNAKWTGASPAALFNTKEANHEAAIAECTKTDSPLLKQVDKGGALTTAGFERIAGALQPEEVRTVYDQLREALPDDQVGVVARAMAGRLTPGERVEFIQGVIRRTPLAATELTPLLEEAVAATKADHEKRIVEAAKRKAAEDAALQAMERAKQLFAELRQNRLDALKREWEAEGADPTELREPERKPESKQSEPKPERKTGPEPVTLDGKEYRRHCADQFAAAWRATWDEKKDEARDYVESAMWNIRGLELTGKAGDVVNFNGLYHECPQPVSGGQSVAVVRPGWVLEESQGDYVPLKVLVKPV